jgi:hypothetical protein
LVAGTYTLEFSPKWEPMEMRDYGVIIQAPIDVVITDAEGKTSRLTSHDLNNKALKPEVAQKPKPEKPKLPDLS